jgi:hypothetical protein
MMTSIKPFVTETLEVVWGHLHRPDDKFGADSSNHNVTILVDKTLQKKLDELQKESSAIKINGMQTDDDGRTLLKVKSKIFVKKGVQTFPCRDAGSNKTEATPFGGDKVRLRLNPSLLDRDNSMSIYLNGCQIIEKNASDTGGFSTVDGGFDGSDFKMESTSTPETPADTEEIPF